MRINFFEEFSTGSDLRKAGMIHFPSTVYVAAKSFKHFNSIRKKLKRINSNIDIAYWPILEKSYWLSPFSFKYEIENLYWELLDNKEKTKLKVLLDLELPFLNRRLFKENFFSFLRNKRLIRKIFQDSKKLNIEISTAEYNAMNWIIQKKFELLGISYPIKKYQFNKIMMYYSSMIKKDSIKEKIKRFMIKQSIQHRENFQVGLGTIAKGILGDEPILSPENLDRDLKFLRDNNIKNAVIFRLGGLNKEYVKVIKRYL